MIDIKRINGSNEQGKRARVIAALVAGVERSPLVGKLSTDKLKKQMDERFERYCVDGRLELRPLIGSILKGQLGSQEDCLFLIEFVKAALDGEQLELNEPELEVHPRRQARIVKEAQQAWASWAKRLSPGRLQLGKMLVDNRVLTQVQLDRALEHQASLGGRLGTHLVKLGFVAAPALAHYLGIQLNQPSVDQAQLDKVSELALRSIPAELIVEQRVFPLSLKHGTIRVAMVDPSDRDVIDCIAHATGCRVVALVAPEAAVEAAIKKHVRLAQARAVSVVANLGGDDESFEVVHTSQRKTKNAERKLSVVPASPAAPVAKSATGARLVEENRGDFCAPRRPDMEVAAHGVDRLKSELLEASTLEDVLSAAAKHLAICMNRVAAFEVTEDAVRGMTHVGCKLSLEALRQVAVATERTTAMGTAIRDRAPFVARPDASVLDQALAAKLGFPPDAPIVVVPIMESSVVVGVLFAGHPKSVGAAPGPEVLKDLVHKCSLAMDLIELKAMIMEDDAHSLRAGRRSA